MSEKNAGLLEHSLPTAAAVTGTAVMGAIYGGLAANTVVPVTITYAQGITTELSLTPQNGANIDAPFVQLIAPNIQVPTPLPGLDGLEVKSTVLHPAPDDPEAIKQYAALVADFQHNVIEPTVGKLTEHLLTGAGIGAATAATISYLAIRHIRHQRQETMKAKLSIARERSIASETARDDLHEIADEHERQLQARGKRRRLLGQATACLMLAPGVYLANATFNHENPAASSDCEPITALLTEKVPEFKGGCIIGTGRQVNTGIFAIIDYREKAEKPFKLGAQNLTAAYSKFTKGVGKKYIDNPDIITVEHTGDFHCNTANYRYYYRPFARLVKASIIIDTGDMETNSGTMFYEENCNSDFFNAVVAADKANRTSTNIIKIPGNHDSKKRVRMQKGNTAMDTLTGGNNVVSAKDIWITGMENAVSTVWYPDRPASLAAQKRRHAEFGEALAKITCKTRQEVEMDDSKGKSGEPTIITAMHDPLASRRTTITGCADLVLNAHTHQENPPRKYRGRNGNDTFRHTTGSASGAKVGFTLYEAPRQDAPISLFYYDKTVRRFVGYSTITLHKSGEVSIKSDEMPRQAEPSSGLDKMEATIEQATAAVDTPQDLPRKPPVRQPAVVDRFNPFIGNRNPNLFCTIKS